MGSLMGGWDSHIRDSKDDTLMRNKSLTKERIEEFWKLRKKTEDEHFKAISPVTAERVGLLKSEEVVNKEYRRSNSLPIIDTKKGKFKPAKKTDVDDDVDVAELMKSKCWWTRSNWAFLNEPPVLESEAPRYKYASQHHVATLGSCN